MIWMFFLSLTAIFSAVNIIFSKKPRTAANILEIILLYVLVFQIGVSGLIAYAMHVFNGPAVAAMIGWPAGSPFQYEVGMMNLGQGVLGILCIWFRKDFWLATVIVAATTMIGCGVGHIRDLIINANNAPYNAGFAIILQDGVFPVVWLGLVLTYKRLNKV